MCHHSLPSIISPIRDKSVVVKIFLVDYICILIAYVGLGMASLLAFGGLPDNPSACPPSRIVVRCRDIAAVWVAFFSRWQRCCR